MTLDDVADRLYALPPEEFTAARTAAAKADKADAKAINALRKPTVSAWLVNTLARTQPELLDQLLALGPALAEAQAGGQGDVLRQLGEQRRQLVGAVTQQAFATAGRSPSAAATAEVEGTLEAALADPASADAVRSGRLTRALSYAGFGTVDLAGAVAAAPSKAAKPKAKTKPDPASDVVEAEALAHAAAGELDDAVRGCEQAVAEEQQREAEEQAAAQAVAAAESALREARERRTTAQEAARAARHRAEQARAAVDKAQAKAEKARGRLDRLRRS